MTAPEPWPADGPKLSEDSVPEEGGVLDEAGAPERTEGAAGLNRPRRVVVAVVELLVVVALVFAVRWAWRFAFTPVGFTGVHGEPESSARLIANWFAASVGFATLAGLFAVDAVRQLMLGVRGPRRGRRNSSGSAQSARANGSDGSGGEWTRLA